MVVGTTRYFSGVYFPEHCIMYLTISSSEGGKKHPDFEKAAEKHLALSISSLNMRTKSNFMHSENWRNLRAGQVLWILITTEIEKGSFSGACLVLRLFLVFCLYSMISFLPPNLLSVCEK